jgi:UDP-N-acetylglucosamine--N-acetylmuramyl-(pentapeptide) pyrophosphoryl-undecaprenol N-acetylglucosamine transferase
VIAAGGTGGHFFPAEALAAELVARGRRITLLTDARSSARESRTFAGQERFALAGGGLAGLGTFSAARSLAGLARGIAQARSVLVRHGAAVIVGFGGYPSVAPVLASRLMRDRPTVLLHEQNAVLGRANRFLARHASALALSFDTTERVPAAALTVVTGNPVRAAIAALAGQPYIAPQGTVRLLVLGGSLGARVFSDIVPPALLALPDQLRARLTVVQQCRPEDLTRVGEAYRSTAIRAELGAFFGDIAEHLRAAHLVIARSGASTIAELGVAGRPAILVPLPGAIDGHQSANAAALAAAGGAWVEQQEGLTARRLGERVAALLADPALLARAAAAAARAGRADAAGRLADLVERMIRQESRA